MDENRKWLDWAVELQSIAQAGLFYGKDKFDLERYENVVKEVKEEAGLDVVAKTVIAVQDREKHNLPIYAYKVCKIFVLCTVIGGGFEENIETVESRYFGIDELPALATEKNNEEQIRMCFDAFHSDNWKTILE